MYRHLRSCGSIALLAVLASLTLASQAMAGIISCQAGRADNWSTADGLESSSPSSGLLVCLDRSTGGSRGQFDTCSIDRFFGHTFVGCLSAADTAATLTLHLRGATSQATTDRIMLGVDGTIRWSLSMNALQSWRTGGADTQWNAGDTATFVLDLDQLPPSTATPSGWCANPTGVVTILALILAGGSLDVGLSDDTCVDYVLLQGSADPTPALPASWGGVKVRYR